MNAKDQDFHRGRPRFRDPLLADRAAQAGPLAAWRDALERLPSPEAAAAAVDGDFAVGIRSASGDVFLAVDRFGIQTLCYRQRGDTLQFAERADELADRGSALDPQAIYDYLYFHTIPSPRTAHAGVFRLPPGHFAWFHAGRLSIQRYWAPHFDEDRSTRFAPLAQDFRRLLRSAVARQLDGRPTACFLSGGTDSSTVVGIAREVTGTAPETYSIGFDEAGYDEMQYARIAARHFGARHHERYLTPDDLIQGIPAVAAHVDQPFGNSSVLPAYFCALSARNDGARQMLAGDGGDELFGGNSRYAMQRLFDWYGVLPRGLRRGVLEPVFCSRVGRLPALRRVASYIDQARTPMPDRLENYNLLLRLGARNVLSDEFLELVDVGDPMRRQRDIWHEAQASAGVNRALAYDWRYTLAENDLPKVRWATSLAGLDVGFPLLDEGLVDFSLRLRDDYKLRGLKLRWFFKEALRGFLPDAIIRKKKHGFALPFGAWVLRHARLREFAFESLQALGRRGVVRPEFIERLLTERLPEHPGYYGEMAWILLMFEQWQRTAKAAEREASSAPA